MQFPKNDFSWNSCCLFIWKRGFGDVGQGRRALAFLPERKLDVICFRRETEIMLSLIFFVSPSFPNYAKRQLLSGLSLNNTVQR